MFIPIVIPVKQKVTDKKFKEQNGQFVVTWKWKWKDKYMLVTEVEGENVKGLYIKEPPKLSSFRTLRKFSIVCAVLMLYVTIVMHHADIRAAFIIFIISIILCSVFIYLAVYSWRRIKTTPEERFIREQFHKIFGYYVMPEWLLNETFKDFYQSIKEHYVNCTNSSDWQENLKRLNPNDDGFAITFCLTYMDNVWEEQESANKALLKNYQGYWKK